MKYGVSPFNYEEIKARFDAPEIPIPEETQHYLSDFLDKFGIKDEFLSRYDENSSNCKIYGGRYNGGDEDCPE